MAQTQVNWANAEDINTPPLAAASATSGVFFVATRPYTIVGGVSAIFSTAGGSGALIDIFHDSGTQAPAGGTSCTAAAAGCVLTGTANTIVSTALGTGAVLNIAAGDRLTWKLSGTLTGLVGCVAAIRLQPA